MWRELTEGRITISRPETAWGMFAEDGDWIPIGSWTPSNPSAADPWDAGPWEPNEFVTGTATVTAAYS